jgi:hypothetical protein
MAQGREGKTDVAPVSPGAASTSSGQPAAAPIRRIGSLPVRPITKGPKYHWFAYYDKFQVDPTNRYVLGMEVDFENRSPEPNDVIKVGMIDLCDGDKWIELGQSSAWCWQQGCMLQWLPGSNSEIIWNDREGDRYVCHIMDVFTREKRTVPWAIYSVSPDGKTAVTTDFRRLHDSRPGYGYAGIPDPYADQLAPAESGIWRVNLETGEKKLIISIAQIVAIPWREDFSQCKHWFNHLLMAPDGKRFIFLHRWRRAGESKLVTRMVTADVDGGNICIVDDGGSTSHFIWRDSRHILSWAWQETEKFGFYLFEDGKGNAAELVGKGVMTGDGHCSYLPGNEWILNDSYPNRQRMIRPYMFHVKTGKVVELGQFYLPPEYRDEWRIDCHPRATRDGKSEIIDSAWEGKGRQMYLIDISRIVGERG